jgi:hypothetical protein
MNSNVPRARIIVEEARKAVATSQVFDRSKVSVTALPPNPSVVNGNRVPLRRHVKGQERTQS